MAEPTTLAVVAIYMAAMLGVAWFVSAKSRDVEGYTVGNRNMSGWVVGLSVLGTFTSSISFLAVPAMIYSDRNWNSFVFPLAVPVAAVVAVRWFVPLYRREVQLSAYEFLERRFGYWARGYADACFLLLHTIRVGMVLLLVALAVQPLLGWNVLPTIVCLGVLVIVYDVLGGIQAVIWTDVVQVAILFGGAAWCLAVLAGGWPGGAGQFFHDVPAGSFSLGDFAAWDLAQSTFLVVFIYAISENLRNYGTDQNYVQRMLAARDDHEASRSIYVGAFGYLPVIAVISLVGTGLSMWYQLPIEAMPDSEAAAFVGERMASLPVDARPDAIFPHFIRHELSPIVAGLVVSAVLAAGMSTVDSSLNSMSTVLLVDVARRLRRGPSRVPEIILLRLFTAAMGAFGTAAAALVYLEYGEGSGALMGLWWKYAGVSGAGLFGLFLLAWLMPRIPPWGAAVAVISSLPVLGLGLYDNGEHVHGNAVGVAGVLMMLVIGGLVRLVAPRPLEAVDQARSSTDAERA